MPAFSRNRQIAIIAMTLLLVFGIAYSASAQYAVGDKVINFKLRDLDDHFVMLNQFTGKIIVLNFFATW
ncbi:hypothetical protein JW960_27405 [candidate division KSB1 bacterium]|nr:hypothetical protein [candidate division KSB1 bacterium]